MKIIVTCGPSYEPIDGARCLTNMSTGKLGVTLANFLSEAGHEAGRQVQPCSDTQALRETLLEWLCSPMSTPAGSTSLHTA